MLILLRHLGGIGYLLLTINTPEAAGTGASAFFPCRCEQEMNDSFTLVEFVEKFVAEAAMPAPGDLESLLAPLSAAERPRSIRVFVWLLFRTLQGNPMLQAKLVESWLPRESDLAQFLEDVGEEGAKTVLALKKARGLFERLWRLADDAGIPGLMQSADLWKMVSLGPMAALVAEQHLDELVAAVVRQEAWKDPATILDPDGEKGELDLEAMIALGQSRMIQTEGGSEALNLTMVRLLRHADRIN